MAMAETVKWEVTELSASGQPTPVAKGVKEYSPEKDIIVQDRTGRDGTTSWTKSLLLNDDFAVAVDVHRAANTDGFALVVYRRGDGNGFSWDWFDRESGTVFAKRQGDGRVSVVLARSEGAEEVASVEFLEDTLLRYLDDMSKPPGTVTHELRISKGSILKVAP
jgi:hypothetical protein